MKSEFKLRPTDVFSNQAGAEYFGYSKVDNYVSASLIIRIPYQIFLVLLYDSGSSRVVAPDISEFLGCEVPAAGHGLCANSIRARRRRRPTC